MLHMPRVVRADQAFKLAMYTAVGSFVSEGSLGARPLLVLNLAHLGYIPEIATFLHQPRAKRECQVNAR